MSTSKVIVKNKPLHFRHTMAPCTLSLTAACRALSEFEPFAGLQRFGVFDVPTLALKPIRLTFPVLPTAAQTLERLSSDDPGFALGILHFDAFHGLEPESLSTPQHPIVIQIPELYIMFYPDRTVIHAQIADNFDPTFAHRKATMAFEAIETRLTADQVTSETPRAAPTPIHLKASKSTKAYSDMIAKAKSHIVAGDVFQVVVSNRFSATVQLDPLTLFDALATHNPSDFTLFVKDGDDHLLVTSPERMLLQTPATLSTNPIAGTRGVKKDGRDAERAADLLSDAKERSEHLMLVDLARNDLAKVCQHGSVKVPRYGEIKTFPKVMHLVSEVVGDPKPDAALLDGLIATFPAGTVSGAPKIRAAQCIRELEGEDRDYYGGSIFISDLCGTTDSCITIRSIHHQPNAIHLNIGSGIVLGSQATDEAKELINKGGALFDAIKSVTGGPLTHDFGH